MSKMKISAELFDDLQGLRRQGESLTEALERMTRTLKDSSVVVTGPGKSANDAWRGGSLDATVDD